jgi:hypothetical protein
VSETWCNTRWYMVAKGGCYFTYFVIIRNRLHSPRVNFICKYTDNVTNTQQVKKKSNYKSCNHMCMKRAIKCVGNKWRSCRYTKCKPSNHSRNQESLTPSSVDCVWTLLSHVGTIQRICLFRDHLYFDSTLMLTSFSVFLMFCAGLGLYLYILSCVGASGWKQGLALLIEPKWVRPICRCRQNPVSHTANVSDTNTTTDNAHKHYTVLIITKFYIFFKYIISSSSMWPQ